MGEQWKIIIIMLLTIIVIVGCQKSNVAMEENINKIEVLDWHNDEYIATITDENFIKDLQEQFASAKTSSTAAVDFVSPDYKLLFKRDEEITLEIGYYHQIMNLGVEGRYWDFKKDRMYGVSLELPRLIDNPNKPYRSEDAIKNGDVVNLRGNVQNIERFESFLANVEAKEKDEIRITSYTIEGDPIFDTLNFNGEKIIYTYDDSQDAYAGSDKGQQSSICSNIEKENTDKGVVYLLSGCSSEVGNAFYFHIIE